MKKERFLSLLLSFILVLGVMAPVSVFAEETGDSVTDGGTGALPEILYEDHFDEVRTYEGWQTANGGEASRGIIDDGANKVYRIISKKTEASTGNADTVLQFTRSISGVFEMKFKVKMYSRGNAFKLLIKSPASPSGHQWIDVFANNGEGFEAPVGKKISSISVDNSWHDFSVVFNTDMKTFKLTRDAVVVCNSTIPDKFDFSKMEIRFQGYTSSAGQTVNAYIDDLYMIQHSDAEEYNGILYENSFDGTKNELLAKGRKGWATVGGDTNEAALELASYNNSDAIHSVAVRGTGATSNADSTASLSGGSFFAGEWKLEADITPIRTNSRLAIALREEDKANNNFYELFSADHGTYKACKVNMADFAFVAGDTYKFKFLLNLFDNTVSVYVNDKPYITDMPFVIEPYVVSKYSLRIQNITSKDGDAGEFYIDNISIRYKDVPKIVLNGNPVERIAQGSTYTDPGARIVYENHTVGADALAVSGNVDTSETGIAYLTYNATVDGVAAQQVTRKVIIEPSSVSFDTVILDEDFTGDALGAKGDLSNSWTGVNGDSKNYAYLGALDRNQNRVLKLYTLRNNPAQANMEATVAKNELNISGLYKFDFDILARSGEANCVNVLFKDNINNINVVPLNIRGNTINVFGKDSGIAVKDDEWYAVSIKVDADAGRIYIDIDGVSYGYTEIADNVSLENVAFRVQNWNEKENEVGSSTVYADNFSITSCADRITEPSVVFGKDGENVTADVTVPSALGKACAVLAVYEGSKLTDVDFANLDADWYLDAHEILSASDTTAANKRISVMFIDGFGNMHPLTDGRTDAE